MGTISLSQRPPVVAVVVVVVVESGVLFLKFLNTIVADGEFIGGTSAVVVVSCRAGDSREGEDDIFASDGERTNNSPSKAFSSSFVVLLIVFFSFYFDFFLL